MIASGGNDNKFMIWDVRQGVDILKSNKHKAAVKAIAWNPHKPNMVLSGGGTHDQTIKIWNSSTCKIESEIDTGSQVCAMKISPHYNEIVTSHGYS
jgi:cell division cycle 20-like protein 1, cofactor of APC complex